MQRPSRSTWRIAPPLPRAGGRPSSPGARTASCRPRAGMPTAASHRAARSAGPWAVIRRCSRSRRRESRSWFGSPAERFVPPVRPAGRGPWKLATVARDVLRLFPQARLLVDPAGRALLTWLGPGGAGNIPALWQSTRLPGGTWSAPTRPAGFAGVGSLSMAMDSTGDVAIVYWAAADSGGPASVRAITLPFGATDWSAPVVISEPDPGGRIEVAGGGGRTFVASWRATNLGARERSEPESVTRTARLRLPGAWEAPRTLMPGALAGTPGAYGVLATHAVDAHGNALAILRWDTGAGGKALAALRLPAFADAWTPPVTLDVPEGREINSPPALTLAQDGSATVTILHIGLAGNKLRFATAPGDSDAWQGAHTDATDIPSCPASLQPWSDVQCPIWMETTPVVEASGAVSTVVIQELDIGASVVVLSRLGPDASWNGPMPLTSVGRTQATLRAAPAGRGRCRSSQPARSPVQRGRSPEDEGRPRARPRERRVHDRGSRQLVPHGSSFLAGSGIGSHTAGGCGRASRSACTRATARASRPGCRSCSPAGPGSRSSLVSTRGGRRQPKAVACWRPASTTGPGGRNRRHPLRRGALSLPTRLRPAGQGSRCGGRVRPRIVG